MYLIHFACENGHEQDTRVDDSLGEAYAQQLAGMLDGTSPLYLYPPDEKSPIGKCGICGKKITATVSHEAA